MREGVRSECYRVQDVEGVAFACSSSRGKILLRPLQGFRWKAFGCRSFPKQQDLDILQRADILIQDFKLISILLSVQMDFTLPTAHQLFLGREVN